MQGLDPATGRLRWSRPANAYYFQEATRTADGFALGYRPGPALDYVHGALLLTTAGRELHDFQQWVRRASETSRRFFLVVQRFPRLVLHLDKHRLTAEEVAALRTWPSTCESH
ncbi:MAG: hypothetical protein EOO36_11350 [Cytophagaceae bacterium]|nr:MAG: hypothetical protein EOO36_11350 [Cytophagaceae bacterium]